jgi:outer membrane lipoprotein-sorting protein
MKFIILILIFCPTLWAISPEDILKKVDEIRNPAESYHMNVRIKSSGEPEDSLFTVALKGNDKTLVKVQAPKKLLGRNMLMLDENMWVYVPNLKRSVRVSLSQKLIGEAANGDISRMRWAGDYDAEIVKETKKDYELFLTQKKKGLTYAKIRTWVGKNDYRPIRAEFLTMSGKVLKTAEYKTFKEIAGKMRPSLILISDALKKDSFSEIHIEKMEVRNLPDSMFTERNLE